MKERIIFLYVTCGSKEEAQKIGKILLEERLCACVNIYPKIESFYWWEGKIEKSEETIIIVKTKESLADLAEQKILQIHSYTCPCIAKIEIKKINECFLNWLLKETRAN